jgi:hypothetical protein
MGKQFDRLDDDLMRFVEAQRIFFAATAAPGARINLSPRATDHFRLLGPNAAVWLDLTGSGNETPAHLAVDDRLTVMFSAFAGPPRILRLYGRGSVIRRGSAEYVDLLTGPFDGDEPAGARQMIRLDFDLVQTSCGFAVPFFDHVGPRDTLARWAAGKTEAELDAYRREKNTVSIDGLPTGLFDETAP